MLRSEVSYHKKKELESPTAPFDPTQHLVAMKLSKANLQQIIGVVFSNDPAITRLHLNNLQKLFAILDPKPFEQDVALYARYMFIIKALDARIKMGTTNKTSLVGAADNPSDPETQIILKYLDEYIDVNHDEILFTLKTIEDILQHSYLLFYRDRIYNVFSKISSGDYDTLGSMNDEVKAVVSNLMTDLRKAESVASMSTFSLEADIFEPFVEETIKNAGDENLALMTGVRALNDILSPGYMPGRLYLWLGVTGGFKSAMLLYSCYWIKTYNKIQPRRKPGARPTVLYITTENSVEESLIRLFNISTSSKDIQSFAPAEAVRLMREKGGLSLKDGETNIIMKYYGNLEISTADLYTIIDEIEEDNNEVVALVFDYIKRIRSAEPTQDEIMRLKYASNELKDLAIRLKIPVITAQQINRAGNMAVDDAQVAGKEDLGKLIGRGNVAQSWDLLENSDWVCILNIEVKRDDGSRWLTMNEIKKRYKTMTDQKYFNHPFAEGSTIMLVDDVNLDRSLSRVSLASDLPGASSDLSFRGSRSAKERTKETPLTTTSFSLQDSLGSDAIFTPLDE